MQRSLFDIVRNVVPDAGPKRALTIQIRDEAGMTVRGATFVLRFGIQP